MQRPLALQRPAAEVVLEVLMVQSRQTEKMVGGWEGVMGVGLAGWE